VGLVGGVGSGKSTLTRRAAELFGLAAIDGDAAGHRALADEDVRAQIRTLFGDAVLTDDGQVDRRELARRVFGPREEHVAAKAALERATHPAIGHTFREEIAAARAAGSPAILLDAAILLEAGWREFCDLVVYIDTPEAVRRSRVAARGWSEDEWRRREAAQLSLDEKRRRADAVVDNSGTLDAAAESLAAVIERRCGVQLSRTLTAPM